MEKEVILYTADWCSGCKTIKSFLKIIGVDYTEVDATSPEGLKFLKEKGISNIPYTIVGGTGVLGSTASAMRNIEKLLGGVE